jgi:hypothetical protein
MTRPTFETLLCVVPQHCPKMKTFKMPQSWKGELESRQDGKINQQGIGR